MPRQPHGGPLNAQVETEEQTRCAFLQIKTLVNYLRRARNHWQHVAGSAGHGPDWPCRAIESSSELTHCSFNFSHAHAGYIVEAHNRFLRARRVLHLFRHIASQRGKDCVRNSLSLQFPHPVLRLFLRTFLVEREINRVQLDACLSDRDQRRICHFLRTQSATRRDRAYALLDLDCAFSSQTPERCQVKPPVHAALYQSMAFEIAKRPRKAVSVPASGSGLFHLEHAKTGFQKFYDFVSRDALAHAACGDQNSNDQGPGIGAKKPGYEVLGRCRNKTLPILMLFMWACRNQVRSAALAIPNPPRAPHEILIFSDAVRRRPRMFKTDNHDGRRRRIDAHRKRCRRDDDAQARTAAPEMFLDDATLFAIQMRIVESNAARHDLTQMSGGLGRIARGEIGESLSGLRQSQSIRQLLTSLTAFSRLLSETDDLLASLDN